VGVLRALKRQLAGAVEAWRTAREARFERAEDHRLGVDTIGDLFERTDASMHGDETEYHPVNYRVLHVVLDALRLGPGDTFVDIGCGKGRVVFAAAERPATKVIGVELREPMFAAAQANLRRARRMRAPVEVFHSDAAAFDFAACNVFFMFNPFGPATLAQMLASIQRSVEAHPRAIRIAYFHAQPACNALLETSEWLELDWRTERVPGVRKKVDLRIWRSRTPLRAAG
jgi:cyclopropane fatty-acyl-phospholipid synthase-like methyltransferase